MAVTRLDPNTALIIVDLQKGIVSQPAIHPIDVILQHARALAASFRQHKLPVVLVTADGAAPGRREQASAAVERSAGWTDPVPELDRQPEDHLVVKRSWGAFTKTDLAAYLLGRDVTQLVIAGVATSIGVESTARQAYELGFNVTLAVDAMTDRDGDAHTNSTTRIFPRLGETGTTAAILDLLERRT